MWLDLLPDLSRHRRVVMIDSIGDLGRSVSTRRLGTRDDVVDWLDSVLAELNIARAAVVGISNGAFLGTVYAIQGSEAQQTEQLGQILSAQWTLPTALSLLAWYVFAPQCLSTLAVIRRETNSWRWPVFLFSYMTTLAWITSFAVYQVGRLLGFG